MSKNNKTKPRVSLESVANLIGDLSKEMKSGFTSVRGEVEDLAGMVKREFDAQGKMIEKNSFDVKALSEKVEKNGLDIRILSGKVEKNSLDIRVLSEDIDDLALITKKGFDEQGRELKSLRSAYNVRQIA